MALSEHDLVQLHEAGLAAALDAVLTIDQEGRLVDWNPAAEKTFGYTREEAVGQDMASLIIPPETRGVHLQGIARFLKTREARIVGRRVEVQAMRKGGETFPCEISFHPIELSAGMYFTAYLRDLTDFKKQGAEVQAAHEAQKKFVADAAHELRTPLTALKGNLDIFFRHSDLSGEEQQEILRDVHQEANRMSRLVQDMLTLARGDTGVDVSQLEVPLGELIHAVWGAFVGRHLRHQFHLGPVPEVTVMGNPDRLRQLLIILLDNATRYTEEGGTITLTANADSDHLSVEVKDTGVGIAQEDQQRVFERFYRVDPARSRSGDAGGSGLGLSIALWIVRTHRGRIELESTAQVGTTVKFTLPLEP
ncbi:ATP-binding protein [Deinococcus cellulosilyticus]|uniref:histidine kinase n=1 Tax=Deinococcus cellulosilyticus (strain DSM 18568 / NBRC 106333 / KACC 11606 / 5516J-15) TaxID=1223518 RepID=A0A511NBY4_DEIC1|nr:ATP-binding protein [Deinococcus cellulosilyticus]GEM50107.1 hypothetical protein DC3_57420 [Deinococcus cellulosilyticus NBRC 106333 = KACC 11606]